MASKISTRLIVALGFLILLIFAFFAPEILFRMQDHQVEEQTKISSMEGFGANITKLSYEGDDVKRLEEFARGLAEGRSYFCMEDGSFAPSEAETADIVARATAAKTNQWIECWDSVLQDVLSYYNLNMSNLISQQQDMETQVRRFLIYDEAFLGGVAFHLYFVELTGYVESIRVVMDAETDMIYYAELELTERDLDGSYKTADGQKLVLNSAGTYWAMLMYPYLYFYEEFAYPGAYNEYQSELKALCDSLIDSYYCKAGNTSSLLSVAEANLYEVLEGQKKETGGQIADGKVNPDFSRSEIAEKESDLSHAASDGEEADGFASAAGKPGQENGLLESEITWSRSFFEFEVRMPLLYDARNRLHYIWYGVWPEGGESSDGNRVAACAGIRELADMLPEDLYLKRMDAAEDSDP